jgi:hypothetical protein
VGVLVEVEGLEVLDDVGIEVVALCDWVVEVIGEVDEVTIYG